MAELMERVAAERRRLRQVRMALTQATEQTAKGDSSWAPFYIAIADYFETTMARLHAQDIRLGEMLRAKAEQTEQDVEKALGELDERLTGNQEHLQKMLAARAELHADASAALEKFEAAGKAYAHYIVTNMGHHPGSTDIAAEVFTPDDWAYMADASEADQAKEAELHAKVFAAVPDKLKLDQPD